MIQDGINTLGFNNQHIRYLVGIQCTINIDPLDLVGRHFKIFSPVNPAPIRASIVLGCTASLSKLPDPHRLG
ncbi:MAG: hypothetical protein IPM36_09490 [Lewinellaceae bacterium]|nr:hypothetical protein [Lewinellaceae bacterium]